jgi:hypothetical protein
MAQQYTEDRSEDVRGSRGRRGGRVPGWGGSGHHDHPHRHGHRDHGGRFERPEFRSGRGGALGITVASLIAAVRQVALIGDETQQQSARVLVEDAVRGIYSILAGGPTPTAPTSGPTAAEADAVTGDGTQA